MIWHMWAGKKGRDGHSVAPSPHDVDAPELSLTPPERPLQGDQTKVRLLVERAIRREGFTQGQSGNLLSSPLTRWHPDRANGEI